MKPLECTPLAASPITASPAATLAASTMPSRSTRPSAKPARSRSSGAVHVGQLGCLASEQRAACLAAALRDALDHVGDAVGIEPADRDVVEEQHGLGTAGEHVVDAHRHEIDAGIAQAAGLALQEQLRAHAVGAGDEHRIAVAARRDETGKATQVAQDTRCARRRHGALQALDDGVGGGERDARLGVGQRLGAAHARAGSRSKRSLPPRPPRVSERGRSPSGRRGRSGRPAARWRAGGLPARGRRSNRRPGARGSPRGCARRRSARRAWPCRCRRSRVR